MALKSGILLAWFTLSYILLVFAAGSLWQGVLLSASLALAVAGIGFAIQHDANHGAYSQHPAVNRVLGMTLDMMGASSYVWRFKHNVFHHTYPNVTGADDDINLGWLGRLAPSQPRRRGHRLQQFYMWGLYGFLTPKWHFVDDVKNVLLARISGNRFPRPAGWNGLEFIAGKAFFFSWALVLPMFFHPILTVLIFYFAIFFAVGITLGIVFQLAHCVEEAQFPRPTPGTSRVRGGWAAHQVRTTVDFARGNRLLSWYLGGLNFQIEHHLFPKISHIHYPQLAVIVEEVCGEYGVPYAAHDGVFSAIVSHWRWLRRMGLPVAAT